MRNLPQPRPTTAEARARSTTTPTQSMALEELNGRRNRFVSSFLQMAAAVSHPCISRRCYGSACMPLPDAMALAVAVAQNNHPTYESVNSKYNTHPAPDGTRHPVWSISQEELVDVYLQHKCQPRHHHIEAAANRVRASIALNRLGCKKGMDARYNLAVTTNATMEKLERRIEEDIEAFTTGKALMMFLQQVKEKDEEKADWDVGQKARVLSLREQENALKEQRRQARLAGPPVHLTIRAPATPPFAFLQAPAGPPIMGLAAPHVGGYGVAHPVPALALPAPAAFGGGFGQFAFPAPTAPLQQFGFPALLPPIAEVAPRSFGSSYPPIMDLTVDRVD